MERTAMGWAVVAVFGALALGGCTQSMSGDGMMKSDSMTKSDGMKKDGMGDKGTMERKPW
ncbi:MAG: hypothetical protein HYU41_18615 [Candidatus Rokubacteria bacterium]|nr:hypothetical protein [Candidatus Rokubacteria bacterium]